MIEEKQKTFKDIQSEYDQLFRTEPIRDEDRAYRWHARELFKAKPDARNILDLACGGGFFLRELRNCAPGSKIELTGVDISHEALELAKKECPQAKLFLGVGESLPFKDKSFDAITCLGSLEHFLNLGQAIGEMKRIAKKGAVFFILVPNLFWYKDILWVLFTADRKTRNQTHERFASWGEWKRLLEEEGLKVRQTIKYNGIAKRREKQWLKDLLIPTRFSYHFLFICEAR